MKNIMAKIGYVVVLLALVIAVLFGSEISAAVDEAMASQTESLIDQLLR